MANEWPTGAVDELIYSTLANDSTIKTSMGISGALKARVSGYRVVREPDYFPYIFFYEIPGPSFSVNGNRIVVFNPDYDFEVRTLGAPTDDSEAIIDRMLELMKMTRTLTPGNVWVVSSVMKKEINITESGETNETYYTRRGATFKFQIVRS